ncbi:MAG: transcriptional repressor [Sulfurospirillaceae bacterium]|nr:transcriptional repressor [Sulfurospirillaceae bacterium]
MNSMENIEYDRLIEEFKDVLKKNLLKFTRQREIVIQTLYNFPEHFSPEELYMLIKSNHPKLNIGIATIYRTLNLLEDSNIVTSLSFGQAGKKFELANKPHHDHLICKNCGLIIEFEDKDIEKKQEKIAETNGFKLTGHIMQLYGICTKCLSRTKTKNK